ncbi:hypothetical protein EG327_004052 [Venturia inaequalis]|uniref:Nudix hydrolase domain-containing protein n=1 Tax=Venturia inaequalis TaxID=5025 RepID=A0A8H3VHJ7_VENIN|nr:hypothetical protein EG327_004052 [Venturia inaequalis]
MATLKPIHAAAIERLRKYVPPPTQYYSLPVSRRAAVLILLYADAQGELRVVLTMRATTLSSYAGQAALPGGKADDLTETPFQTARREAFEEIGLPLSDDKLPKPFRIEHLCQLPTNFARTELGVRPCVAFLSPHPDWPKDKPVPNVEETLIPRLDAREVAAVFTAPLHNFLKEKLESDTNEERWYDGLWMDWNHTRWRFHNFYVPVAGQRVAWASPTSTSSPAVGSTSLPYRDIPRSAKVAAKEVEETTKRFRVFGMTGRIMVDAARVAYGEAPGFEHTMHLGDEDMIGNMLKEGRLGPLLRKRPGDHEDGDAAAAAKI